MNRNGQIRIHQFHQAEPLFRIHGDHEQGHRRRRDGRAAEVDEHEIDVLPRVAFGDFLQFGHEKGVARDVDSAARFRLSVFFSGVRVGGLGRKGERWKGVM